MLLPASTLAAINNVVALHLEPDTTMKVLGAILAPVLSSDSTPARKVGRPGPKPRKATRPRKRRRPTREARDRARAALEANPNATLADVAKAAGVSHGTAINARKDLAAEARKAARKETRKSSREKSKAAKPERRERAERFLRDALAHGPKPVADLEDAAEKAHVDQHSLEQARGDLGVVVSRGNAGGVQAAATLRPRPFCCIFHGRLAIALFDETTEVAMICPVR